jgi:hypothetical protein
LKRSGINLETIGTTGETLTEIIDASLQDWMERDRVDHVTVHGWDVGEPVFLRFNKNEVGLDPD